MSISHSTNVHSVAALMAIMLSFSAYDGLAVGTVSLSGTAEHVLSISTGSLASSGVPSLSSSQTGGSVGSASVDQENANATIDFGDVSRGDGQPIVAAVAVRLRSNCPFRLFVSRQNYYANNLQFLGRNVSGASDGGSFIRFSAGPNVTPTGRDADASTCHLSGALASNGVPLSQLSSGEVSRASTLLASGNAVSLRGSKASPSNAVDIPIKFSVPTGTALGPLNGGTGTFSATIQIAAISD